MLGSALSIDACQRATNARDPRFDGVFFIGVTTTRVYCRPVCPARVTYPERRRFFPSAAAAEHAGFRPCLRCRPELAPGRALCDAVPRLATSAARRIAAGALNGRSVGDLAHELSVSERHLRRALERELGVSPIELAQTHRLLLAKQLLADTRLSVSRIAYASGFQSLRRFNAVFRERYRMSPNALRRERPATPGDQDHESDCVRLTLAYRPPLAWEALLRMLRRTPLPGVERFDGSRYARTIRIGEAAGVIVAEIHGDDVAGRVGSGRRRGNSAAAHVVVQVSSSLVPVLMPLLARLRHLFDLDAEPAVVDAHLSQGGLSTYVGRRPGLRLPGAVNGFEAALRVVLGGAGISSAERVATIERVVQALGEPIETRLPGLVRLAPSAETIANARPDQLVDLGVSRRRAQAIISVARSIAGGTLSLEPGAGVEATYRALREDCALRPRTATLVVMRALHWPDAFPASDRVLWSALEVTGPRELIAVSNRWRPWRAYAAMHLWLAERASLALT